MKLIGLAGQKGVGKDEIANMLVRKEGFKKVAFADPLKEMLSNVFRLEPEYFNDRKLKESPLPEYITLDFHHIDKIRNIVENEYGYQITVEQRDKMETLHGIEIRTPRELMQIIGTDILRDCVSKDIFINLFFTRIKDFGTNICVSDVRLKNEREAIKKANGHMLLVKREGLENKDSHISENDLGKEEEYHTIVNNDSTLQQLESELLMWYSIKVKYK